MEIRHLKLIRAIVEEGSITKAIHVLHLTQSALSHQLREAEYQLGTKIFLRSGKKWVLTQAGQKLYATAKEVTDKLASTEQEIKKMVFGESGQIRISTECFTGYHWLPRLMKQFHRLYPNVELRIVMEATHYPLQKLLAGELDLAIVSDLLKDDKIQYTELFQDEMIVIVPDNHAWVHKKYVVAEDFSDQNLIIHSLPMETVTVHQALLAPAKVTPKKVTILPLTEASVEMVKAEMGIMVMARWAAKPYIQHTNLCMVKIGKNGLKRKHYIALLKSNKQPDYFSQFIEFIKTEILLT